MSGLIRILLVVLGSAAVLRAGQVNWGSAFGAVNLTSGGGRMNSQMTFELGVFATGFTPTAANTAEWSANWRRAQLAFYNVELAYFTGSHVVASNAAPFTAGAKGYIWGHDGRCAGGEWILMSAPSWVWPTQSTVELPVNWTVSTATQFVTGQGNGGGFQMKSAVATGALPVTTWADWRVRMFSAAQLNAPEISGSAADPDGDGLANLAEYALGGNALVCDGLQGRMSASLTFSGGRERLTMTVLKRCDRVVGWSAQASLDLLTWPASSVTLTETAETLMAVENLSAPGGNRVFLRPVFQLP